MDEKEESKIENQQNNQKEFKPYREKGKIYDDNVIFKGELPIKFNEFDPQKGGLSPKILFRKRKSEDTSIYFKKNKNGEDILGPTIKKETRIKNAFEALLDYVREVYFTNDLSVNDDNANNNNSHNNSHNNDCFKFTSLDLLINHFTIISFFR